MALFKNQFARYRIIDECLQNRYHTPSTSARPEDIGYWPIIDLMVEVSRKLDLQKIISERQIKEDIRRMKEDPDLSFYAPIINKKGVGYTYSDPNYSLSKLPLSPAELDALKDVIKILSQFKGFKYFSGAEGMIHQIEVQITQSEFHDVQFDILSGYSGLENIEPIRKAIKEKTVLKIRYRPFQNDEVSEVLIHPYLLKEYNNRWFVYAYTEEYNSEGIYGLERITNIIEETFHFYRKPDKKKIISYFRDIIGVTNLPEQQVEEIIIALQRERAMYLLTKPQHHSQEDLGEKDGIRRFRFRLKPNQEFIALLLSFGDDLVVEKPASLVAEMQRILERACSHYR